MSERLPYFIGLIVIIGAVWLSRNIFWKEDPRFGDEAQWERAAEADTIKAYVRYLRNFTSTYMGDRPSFGDQAPEARARIHELVKEELAAIEGVPDWNTIQKVEDQLLATHTDAARAAIQDFRDQWIRDYEWVKTQNVLEGYQRYLELHPRSDDAENVKSEIRRLEIEAIQADDTEGREISDQAWAQAGNAETATIMAENAAKLDIRVTYIPTDSKYYEDQINFIPTEEHPHGIQHLIIPVGESKSIELSPGKYRVLVRSLNSSAVFHLDSHDQFYGKTYFVSYGVKEQGKNNMRLR